MTDSVRYKGFDIFADGFGKEGGDRWQPTLSIARQKESADAPDREKQFWIKYPKQFYPSRAAAAAVAVKVGRLLIAEGAVGCAAIFLTPEPVDELRTL